MNPEPPFLLIEGAFSGIQDYLFTFRHAGVPKLAKTLRARSALFGILSKLIETELLRRTGLPATSVLTAAASIFRILAPRPDIRPQIERLEEEVQRSLRERYFGAVSFSLNCAEGGHELLTQPLKPALPFQGILRDEGGWREELFRFDEAREALKEHGPCLVQGQFPAKTRDGPSPVAALEEKLGGELPHSVGFRFSRSFRWRRRWRRGRFRERIGGG